MQKQFTILAVDDELNMRRLLEISLRQAGYKPVLAADGYEALAQIKSQHIDLVVSDLHMPGMSGLALLKAIHQDNETLPFIMVTALGEIKTAVEAMKLGASDYILRPFDLETLEIAIAKALSNRRLQLENTYLKANKEADFIGAGFIGESPPIFALKQLIQQVAPEKATVLITGETGTGKELVAQAIHAASLRKNGLFVAINCAAIPADILESELFGHEKGAFTGAIKERVGKFELADGGTLFLDEISEMPIQLQAKLLRVLQEGVVEKIGSNKSLTLDVRVIAATNREPLQAVREGKLREDLYYRLNVFQLNTPSLRERPEDIKRLVHYFLAKSGTQISDTALIQLQGYAWPGNVRELENILERASILAAKQIILPQHLPADILPSAKFSDDLIAADQPFSIPKMAAQIEKKLIIEALAASNGNKAKAAKLLEISERSLWYKLDQLNFK